jgi:hypothetical protein
MMMTQHFEAVPEIVMRALYPAFSLYFLLLVRATAASAA